MFKLRIECIKHISININGSNCCLFAAASVGVIVLRLGNYLICLNSVTLVSSRIDSMFIPLVLFLVKFI